jgi:hypothetical protein
MDARRNPAISYSHGTQCAFQAAVRTKRKGKLMPKKTSLALLAAAALAAGFASPTAAQDENYSHHYN